MAFPSNPQHSGGLPVKWGIPSEIPTAIQDFFLGKCRVTSVVPKINLSEEKVEDLEGYKIAFTKYDQQAEYTIEMLEYEGLVMAEEGDTIPISGNNYVFSDIEPLWENNKHRKIRFKLTFLPRMIVA